MITRLHLCQAFDSPSETSNRSISHIAVEQWSRHLDGIGRISVRDVGKVSRKCPDTCGQMSYASLL